MVVCGFLCAVAGCVTEEQVVVVEPAPAPPQVVLSEADFQPLLAPHGEWIDVPPHGLVWRPHVAVVGVGFVPYATSGEWVYTDHGWSFETEWEWGWAPFHYGHWCFVSEVGWVWLPGTVWAPAWVAWRSGGGFIGWAPLPPPGFVTVETHWIFVERHVFVRRHVSSYVLSRERAHVAFEATAPVGDVIVRGGVRWHPGPRVTDVEHAVGTRIHPVRVVPPARGVIRPVPVRPHRPGPPIPRSHPKPLAPRPRSTPR
jgi:hypothetical protein